MSSRAAPHGETASSASGPPRVRVRTRLAAATAVAGLAAGAYMAFEARWVRCRETDLPVPGLPAQWSGLTILHLSDIHAGMFRSNDRCLVTVVDWAERLSPDLVFLTGDILGDPKRSQTCLGLLARLQPRLGAYAVTGNHEYGLSKAPLARPFDTSGLWAKAGITLLSDGCHPLPPREGVGVVLCGADYISGGYGLLQSTRPSPLNSGPRPDARGPTTTATSPGARGSGHARDFPILLIHEPPPYDSPLCRMFPLIFAGHTHGGQLRVPTRSGLVPINRQGGEQSAGVKHGTTFTMVISRGTGTSFLPFRLLTRPEATLWRLVYTSYGQERKQVAESERGHP